MKNKLTKNQIEEIKELSKEVTITELSKKFKVSLDTIRYHLFDSVKEKKRLTRRKYYQNLSSQEKKEVYEKSKERISQRRKSRYHSDPEYRLKEIERAKEYRRRKKE